MEQRRPQPCEARPKAVCSEDAGLDATVREALRTVETPAGLRERILDALRRGVRDRAVDDRDLSGPERE